MNLFTMVIFSYEKPKPFNEKIKSKPKSKSQSLINQSMLNNII